MTADIQKFRIFLAKSDEEFSCAADETILAAALRNGLMLANSCRNGSCRTCLCQMQHGQIAYTIEWPGVSFDEKSEGTILPCVAQPRSDLVLVNLVLSRALG